MTLKTFGIVIAVFSINDKGKKSQFFKKAFFLADIIIDIVLEIPFFTLSNSEINFLKWELNWRLYTIIEALQTTKWVELVEKKEFIAIVFNLDDDTFIAHIAFLASLVLMSIPLIELK